jgi:hypothetical protein
MTSAGARSVTKRCSVCKKLYPLSTIRRNRAERTGEPWVCPAGHHQLPAVLAAIPHAIALLNEVTKERDELRLEVRSRRSARGVAARRDIARLQKRNEALEQEITRLRAHCVTLERAARRPPSARLREAQVQQRRAERQRDRLRTSMDLHAEDAARRLDEARRSGQAAVLSTLFDSLHLGSCPAPHCSFRFSSLEDLLLHARASHRGHVNTA